jgi:hypothetical protein
MSVRELDTLIFSLALDVGLTHTGLIQTASRAATVHFLAFGNIFIINISLMIFIIYFKELIYLLESYFKIDVIHVVETIGLGKI